MNYCNTRTFLGDFRISLRKAGCLTTNYFCPNNAFLIWSEPTGYNEAEGNTFIRQK